MYKRGKCVKNTVFQKIFEIFEQEKFDDHTCTASVVILSHSIWGKPDQ